MFRENIKLILSILVIVLVVALGIYLQKMGAPVYGIPGFFEKLLER